MKDVVPFEGLQCANCGTPLQGEYCFHCGQSVHSVLKPVHNMLEETVETVLHIDGRILHTLPPLMCKPGFLTLEYFSGRRMRYIAPFRLMFVLCLLAFFVVQIFWASDFIEHDLVLRDSSTEIASAGTHNEVVEQLQGAINGIEVGRPYAPASVLPDLDKQEAGMRQQARARLIALGETPAAASSAVGAIDSGAHADHGSTMHAWFSAPSNYVFAPLPGFLNVRVNRDIDHFKTIGRLAMSPIEAEREEGLERLKTNTFAVLPQTMFVMIPVFALLLKLFYLFRRRLYMEHLIVALHSHAFLFVSLMAGVLVSALGAWIIPHANWAASPFRWLEWAIFIWVLIYLFLMQKRVYRQSWPMTTVKYIAIGWCYVWIVFWCLLFALAMGLTH